jgi:hypothetical protein
VKLSGAQIVLDTNILVHWLPGRSVRRSCPFASGVSLPKGSRELMVHFSTTVWSRGAMPSTDE